MVAVCSFLSWQQYVRYADQTRHSNEAVAALNQTLAAVESAESSQRGYLLTSDPTYREQYLTAVSQAEGAVSGLDHLSPEAKQQRLITGLQGSVNARLQELALGLHLAQNGQTSRARDLVQARKDTLSKQQITSLAAEYFQRLQTSIRGFREDSRFYARLSQWVSTLGCTGIFAIVYFGNRKIVRLLSTTASLNAELTQVNVELQQFVYSASHDLREPLRTLVIYSQLVERKARQGLSLDVDLDHLRSAARLMTQIVEDLLTYTQTANEGINPEQKADMNTVMENVRESLRIPIRETNAEILHGLLPVLPISEVHARILLQNLVSNALKYHQRSVAPRIRLDIRQDGANWILSVADNGIGIKAEYQEQIFGLFKRLHSRTEYPGTGLGLAICKKIVDRYQGSIGVESKIGEGATFRVRLPVHP